MALYDNPTSRYGVSYYDGYAPPERIRMAKVSLRLGNKTKSEVLTFAKNIHTNLTGNAFVTTPSPSLAAMQTAITNAQNAFDAYEAEKDVVVTKKGTRDDSFVVLENILRAEAVTVQTATGGNATEILSTGYEVASSPTTAPAPGQVLNLRVKASDIEGMLKAAWKRETHAQRYEIQASIDPPTSSSWALKGSSNKTKADVNSFTSGQKIWLRVRAQNAAGDGAWSDPAVKIVP